MRRQGRRRARRRRRRGTRDDRSGRRAGPAATRRRRNNVVSIADVGRGTTAPSQAPGRVRRIWSARTPSALVRPDLAGPATRTWSPGRTAKPIGPRSASPTPTRTTSSSGGTTSRSSIATWSGSDPTPGAARRGGGHVVAQTRHRILERARVGDLRLESPVDEVDPPRAPARAHRRRADRTSRARPGRPGGTATSGPRSPPAPRGCLRADPPRWPPPHRPPALRPAHGPARRAGRSGGTPPARLAAPGGRRSARAGGADAGGSARCHAVARAPWRSTRTNRSMRSRSPAVTTAPV